MLSLSIREIMKRVYATSALRCYVGQNRVTVPKLLTGDRENGLRIAVSDALACIVVDLMPKITSCRLSADGEMAEIELSCESAMPMLPLVDALESAVAAHVMGVLLQDCDSNFSKTQLEIAEAKVKRVADILEQGIAARTTRIKPHNI